MGISQRALDPVKFQDTFSEIPCPMFPTSGELQCVTSEWKNTDCILSRNLLDSYLPCLSVSNLSNKTDAKQKDCIEANPVKTWPGE